MSEKQREQKIPEGSQRQDGVMHTPRPTAVRSLLPAQRLESTYAREVTLQLLERVVEESNLQRAMKRVMKNKGAAGADGMTVEDLPAYFEQYRGVLQQGILEGSYQPQAVRRVEIPKANGKGKRDLGIPTVVDRLVQQAILQVLEPIFEPGFSERSYGFRPGRSAKQAIRQAQVFIREGYRIVVDIDLENFFNQVNHDMLMARLARKIGDKRLLKLLRLYLNAGVMINGVCIETEEGVPQGGPLSPLLSNIMLDDLDKELERRGHRFVRYADDQNVYVKTKRAGQRVFESIKHFVEKKLKLKINEEKSAVAWVSQRKFLGFTFTKQRDARVRIAPQALSRVKDRLRRLTSRTWSISMEERIQKINEYLRGWLGYFQEVETPTVFSTLEGWLKRRLRQCQLKSWKKPKTRLRRLIGLGLDRDCAAELAFSRKGTWRLALTPQLHVALGDAYWSHLGLLRLSHHYASLRKTS